MEVWRTISHYRQYQVSSLGRVRNIKTNRILNSKSDSGCPAVTLYKRRGHERQKVRVHILMEAAGFSIPEEIRGGRRPVSKPTTATSSPPLHAHAHARRPYYMSVYCRELDEYFSSAAEASRCTGVNHNSITRACIGTQKTAGKMHWEYKIKK